jgi:hypothetical protein
MKLAFPSHLHIKAFIVDGDKLFTPIPGLKSTIPLLYPVNIMSLFESIVIPFPLSEPGPPIDFTQIRSPDEFNFCMKKS